jgi:hypothetical protein
MNDYKSLHSFNFTHFYTPIPQVDVIDFFYELPVKILLIKTNNKETKMSRLANSHQPVIPSNSLFHMWLRTAGISLTF